MKSKGIFLKLIALITIIFIILTGCASTSSIEKVSLTYVKAPLNVPSIIQKNKELFEKEFEKDKIKLEYSSITEGPQQTQALAAGKIDFLNAVGGTSAILSAANGVDLKIISTYSRSPKAFMIITNSNDIKSPQDLKGKKIAGPKGTILHQLLITYLDKIGLKNEDVEFVSMAIPDALSALSNNSVDVALVAGPAALKAINSGAKVITDGEGLVDATIVVATSGKMVEEHRDIVDRFLKVQNESVDYIKNNLDEAMDITANEVGISKEEVKKMYEWYDFSPQIKESDIKSLKDTQDFLIKNGMLEKAIDIDSLILK